MPKPRTQIPKSRAGFCPKRKRSRRLIPETHCIRIFMWRNEDPNYQVGVYEGYKPGMACMSTGAGSLQAAMKIIRERMTGPEPYTHWTLHYPIAMMGCTKNEPQPS